MCQRWCESRPRAPPWGSVYCTFPTKARLPHQKRAAAQRRPRAHKSQPRPSGAHARTSSSRRLGVTRLPHNSQPRPSGPQARTSFSKRLCVYCACHTKASRSPAPTRAPAPPEGSVYRACHTNARQSGVMSCAVTSGVLWWVVLWWVKCEKWCCEKWCCDELWCNEWDVIGGAVMRAVWRGGCDKWCDELCCDEWDVRSGRAGGRGRGSGGCKAKNKNPTQWCGEIKHVPHHQPAPQLKCWGVYSLLELCVEVTILDLHTPTFEMKCARRHDPERGPENWLRRSNPENQNPKGLIGTTLPSEILDDLHRGKLTITSIV